MATVAEQKEEQKEVIKSYIVTLFDYTVDRNPKAIKPLLAGIVQRYLETLTLSDLEEWRSLLEESYSEVLTE